MRPHVAETAGGARSWGGMVPQARPGLTCRGGAYIRSREWCAHAAACRDRLRERQDAGDPRPGGPGARRKPTLAGSADEAAARPGDRRRGRRAARDATRGRPREAAVRASRAGPARMSRRPGHELRRGASIARSRSSSTPTTSSSAPNRCCPSSSRPATPRTPPGPTTRDRGFDALVQTVDVLVGLLELGDPHFRGSSHRVTRLVRAVAEELAISRELVQEVVLAEPPQGHRQDRRGPGARPCRRGPVGRADRRR